MKIKYRGSLTTYSKWKKPIRKGYIFHDSNYMIFWKEKKKTIKKITRSVVERGGNRRRRDKWTKPRRFLWQWTILYDAALVANNRMNNTKCES